MSGAHFTVVLVPAQEGWIAAFVPAMPGCVSQGRTRDEALANAREAMSGWSEVEADQGRGPLTETSGLILEGVSQALEIIDEMRAAGEVPQGSGYGLELATVDLQQPVAA